MSNAPEYFYRTFYIRKRNGKQRRIDEPLPDLKKVQSWILTEILYKVPCSKFAKAYVPHTSIKMCIRDRCKGAATPLYCRVFTFWIYHSIYGCAYQAGMLHKYTVVYMLIIAI